jgi:hypothetical protein
MASPVRLDEADSALPLCQFYDKEVTFLLFRINPTDFGSIQLNHLSNFLKVLDDETVLIQSFSFCKLTAQHF